MDTSAPGRPISRRDAYRQSTLQEIKDLARRQLADGGPAGLSLRAIARQMRMASSALYRYFANADDLISALCVDAYDSAADTLADARDALPENDHAGRWRAVCHAYRQWARDNPADFALIFGTPIPGYQAAPERTGPAAGRFAAAWFATYAAAAETGAADPDCAHVPHHLPAGPLLGGLVPDAAPGRSTHLAAITLTGWASVLGFLTAETFGSLPQLIADPDRLYDAHIDNVMRSMGFGRTSYGA